MELPLPSPAPLNKSSSSFGSSKSLLVSVRQKQNPMMKYVKNVQFVYESQLTADFHINQNVGCVYLSMKYHMLQKNYIAGRLDQMLGYTQRILLLFNDSEVGDGDMVELSAMCIVKNVTLLVGFSLLECGRYLETLKLYENKPADWIKGDQANKTFEEVFGTCLTTIRSVNSSDVAQLGSSFGTMENLVNAKYEELLLQPGMGVKKAKAIKECFDNPY